MVIPDTSKAAFKMEVTFGGMYSLSADVSRGVAGNFDNDKHVDVVL